MIITVLVVHNLSPYEKCQNCVPIQQLVRDLMLQLNVTQNQNNNFTYFGNI